MIECQETQECEVGITVRHNDSHLNQSLFWQKLGGSVWEEELCGGSWGVCWWSWGELCGGNCGGRALSVESCVGGGGGGSVYTGVY